MPKVSVVMPIYNVESYVASAIQSVLQQTFTDFELLLVIDGATDNSLVICKQFDDPRIRIIEQQNRGLAGARNTGIRQAQGEYIALLDADDLWLPEKLAKQVAHLDNNPEVGISYAISAFIDEQDRSLGLYMSPKLQDITPQEVFCRNPVGNGSVPMIRQAVFAAIAFQYQPGNDEMAYFDESFRQSEDIECWMRMALLTKWQFAGINQVLIRYRVNAGGLSANLDKQYQQWQRMVDKMRDYAPTFLQDWEAPARAYQLRYLARRAVRMRNAKTATRLMSQSLACYKALLWQEPGRTLSTLAAAWLLRLLPLKFYQTLEQWGVNLSRKLK